MDNKGITSPQVLIHYCIFCAMEHEEAEMQDIMDNFIKNELERQKSKIIAIAKDSGNIYELVKRINLLK